MKTKLLAKSLFVFLTTIALSLASTRAQTQLIQNGGFESGSANWTLSGGAAASSNGGFARSGTYFLWLGGAVNENDSAYQDITIPSTATTATLSFYYNINSLEGNTVANDTFTVTIRNTSGTILATVGNWSNENQTSPGNPYYYQQTFNLEPYAGQTIRIYFASANNSSLVTNFRVDDVSVSVTAATTYIISVSASPSAGGTVSGGGTFASGSSRTVTATANGGYTFADWTENGSIVSYSASYSFTLNANRNLVANFTQNQVNYTIAVSASPSAGGTVSGGGTFASGSSRTVTATPNSGYTFVNWTESGSQVSTSSSYTFTLNANRTLVANFTTSGTQPLGIDVSQFQGSINWSQVSNPGGKAFALIRATAGVNTTDSQFAQNIVAAKNAGLLVGAWHFAYPQYFTAQQEAQKFLSVAGPYIGAGYLPPMLDIEDSPSENSYPYQMGSAALSQWITNWCAIVEQAAGVKPIIYATRDYARNYFAAYVNQYPYWVVTDSGVSDSDPGNMGIWSTWMFQQYEYGSSGGTCPGVSGPVDLDSFNGDRTTLQALTDRTTVTAPAITSPTPGSTLTSSSATFQWSSGMGVSDYFLYVGNSLGTNDIYGQDQGMNQSVTVTGLPTDGRMLYVRLWWQISGVWYSTEYTYTAYTLTATPAITSPVPNSTLTSSSATFQWSSGTVVSDYFLYVGSSFSTNDIYGQDQGLNLSVTVNNLPQNGSTLYVRLWWEISSVWNFADYTYTAYTQPVDILGPALTIASPLNNATVSSASLSVSGTASDNGYGNDGVSSVTVNGVAANNDTASGSGTANWNTTIALHSGQNTITVIAKDTLNNQTSQQRTVTYNPPQPVFGGSSVSNGQLQTTLSGLSVGETVVLYSSTDLKTWTLVQTKVATGSSVTFAPAINPALSAQYFRVQVQ